MNGRVLLGALLALSLIAGGCASASGPTFPAPRTPVSPAPAPVADVSSSAEDGRHLAIVTKVRMAEGGIDVVADYITLLEGAEASAAAAARGSLSPPPGGYLIVNDERLPRTLSVSAHADVRILTGSGTELRRRTTGEFLESWLASREGDPIRREPYWLTVEDGRVTRIEQRFLP